MLDFSIVEIDPPCCDRTGSGGLHRKLPGCSTINRIQKSVLRLLSSVFWPNKKRQGARGALPFFVLVVWLDSG